MSEFLFISQQLEDVNPKTLFNSLYELENNVRGVCVHGCVDQGG